MCNPRRVRVTATRELREAWQREVSRSIELQEIVTGEARVRQPLGATVGAPVLRAIVDLMSRPESGWTAVEEGFRHEVEGGYVLYHADESLLEIVAQSRDTVTVVGEATQRLGGEIVDTLQAQGEGKYYDDHWGGRTEVHARRDADAQAQRALDQAQRERIAAAEREAEDLAAQGLTAEAAARAREQMRQQAEQTRADLAAQSRSRMETVGVLARRAFHAVLAQGYANSILAYARLHGASDIHCDESGDTVDIEFSLRA
ncbi:MAG: molecular chaperone DnaJ [Capsulimonadaceae bacterium]